MAKKYALLIGTSQYRDAMFTELVVPEKDVHAFKDVLKDKNICAFDEVETLLNPSYADVQRQIGKFFSDKKKDDLVLLYFSGHGLLGCNRDLYLALKETQYRYPLGTALEAAFIKRAMKESHSKRKLLILDCCYAGAFELGTKAGGSKGIGLQAVSPETFGVEGYGQEILSACGATQLSWEGDKITGETDKSLFTHYLIEGLKTGKAAPEHEEITVEQLYHYAHDQVVDQTPKMKPERSVSRGQGRFVLARNPVPMVKVKTLPEEVEQALEDENPFAREVAVRRLGPWIQSDESTEVILAKERLLKLKETEKHIDVLNAIDAVLGIKTEPPKQTEPIPQADSEKPGASPSINGKPPVDAKAIYFVLLLIILVVGVFFFQKFETLESKISQQASEARRLREERTDKDRRKQEALQKKRNQEAEDKKKIALAAQKTKFKPGAVFRDTLSIGGKGPTMVVIPAGRFQMGDVQGGGSEDERPVHRVEIEKPFAMGKYEVTFDEYHQFVQATSARSPKDEGWGRGSRPVINVSWQDAVDYASWLSQQTGENYGLPSEAEWEYAARVGKDTKYPWGNEIGRNQANCRSCGSQWDNKKTAPVGSFEANIFGLYDTAGNVWEWTEDCWHDTYKNAPLNGKAWGEENGGQCSRRVLRGGSWYSVPSFLHSAVRGRFDSGLRGNNFGFRLSRTLK